MKSEKPKRSDKEKKASRLQKKQALADAKENKRKEIAQQLSQNSTLIAICQKASHLLAEETLGDCVRGQEDVETLLSLLNNDLIEEISEERVNRCLCCNISGTCQSPQISQTSVDTQLKQKITMKKGKALIPPKDQDEKQPQKKVFCSKQCEQTFESVLMPRILEENESQLFMGDFQIVKQAARILQRFTDQLPKDSVFDQMERKKNDKVLADFWGLMDEVTVKVVEKNAQEFSESKTPESSSVEVKGKKVSLEQLEAMMGQGESFVDKEDENPELEAFLAEIIANRVEPENCQEIEEEKKVETESLIKKVEEVKELTPQPELNPSEDPPKARKSFPIVIKTNRRVQPATQEQPQQSASILRTQDQEAAPQVSKEESKFQVNDKDVKAVFEIFDVEGKEEKKVRFADGQASQEEESSEGESESDGEQFQDSRDEIAKFETEMNQFQRINIQPIQILC